MPGDAWATCLHDRLKGYGGTVSVMTGIDTDGDITGVVILSHERDPRPGRQRHQARAFWNQYQQPARKAAWRSSNPDRPLRVRSRP